MKKTVRIEIEICKDLQTGFYGRYLVTDMVFTEFERLLSHEDIKTNVAKAISKLKGFDMLTATLSIYNQNSGFSHRDTIKSFRFTQKWGGFDMSLLKDDMYNNYQPSDKNEMNRMIKDLVEFGNQEFIRLLKTEQIVLQTA